MLRYRLRTLLIVLALGPPVLAGVWWYVSKLFEDGTAAVAGAAFVGSMLFGLAGMAVLIVIAKCLDAIHGPKG